MTLTGVNLYTTYGLKLMSLDGHLDHPPRKKTLKYEAYEYGDFYFDGQKVTVVLGRKFTSYTTLKSVRDSMYTLLLSNSTHTVTITEHSLSAFTATARDGAKVDIKGLMMTITITFIKT